jgi:Uma2 family endonuclease
MNEKGLDHAQRRGASDNFLGADRAQAGGKMIARSGSGRWHNLIVSNTAIAAGSKMHGHKCEIYISNMRVMMPNNFICYPDVVFVAGEPKFADSNSDLLLNPTAVVEIFSSTTNTVDKTKKVESFLEMESIRECVLLKEDEMRVEHYARQNQKQWIYRIYNERDDVVSLESIGVKMGLAEIYAQIKFRQAEFASRAVN